MTSYETTRIARACADCEGYTDRIVARATALFRSGHSLDTAIQMARAKWGF